MKQSTLIVLSALSGVLLHAGTRGATADWSVNVTPLISPASANSAQPQLSVQGDQVVLSWIERAGNTSGLRFSERTDGGWTAPRTAASGTNWFVNWADVPSVVRLQNGNLAAHWLQKSANGIC